VTLQEIGDVPTTPVWYNGFLAMTSQPSSCIEELSPRVYKLEIVGWEITLRCNLQCLHCGSSAGPSSTRTCELDLEECKSVVRQLVALGTSRIVLSGGEPFLCDHWEPLAQFICDQGIYLQFVSNGTLIDDNLSRKLQNLPGKVAVGLSLDGAVPETHENLRNSPGLFQKVLRAIKLLRVHGIPVAVITTVHKDNLAELRGLYKLLLQSGVYVWQIQLAMPSGRMSDHPEMVLSGEESLSLARFIARVRDEGNLRVVAGDNLGYYNSLEIKLRESLWTGCPAGIRALGIRSNGDVTGCLSLQETAAEGNVREKSLAEIWLNPELFSYNRKFKISDLEGECKDCKFGSLCRGGCSFLCKSLTGEYHNNPLCLRLYDRGSDSVIFVG